VPTASKSYVPQAVKAKIRTYRSENTPAVAGRNAGHLCRSSGNVVISDVGH